MKSILCHFDRSDAQHRVVEKSGLLAAWPDFSTSLRFARKDSFTFSHTFLVPPAKNADKQMQLNVPRTF
jgi:hypothetical protein